MDVSRIFTQENLFSFWPANNQSDIEKVYSAARFIIYGTLLAFALKRNTKIVMLGILLLVGLYFYSKNIIVPQDTPISNEDPFDNYGSRRYNKDRATKWSRDTFKSSSLNAERNFYTVPSNDLDSYLDFVHGGRNKPFCRQNQEACTAEHNPRFMDEPNRRVLRSIF